MPSLIDLTLEGRKVGQYGPWPRVAVDASVWTFAASELAHGRWSLLGLWGANTAWRATLNLPDIPALEIPTDGLEARAIAQQTSACPSTSVPSQSNTASLMPLGPAPAARAQANRRPPAHPQSARDLRQACSATA